MPIAAAVPHRFRIIGFSSASSSWAVRRRALEPWSVLGLVVVLAILDSLPVGRDCTAGGATNTPSHPGGSAPPIGQRGLLRHSLHGSLAPGPSAGAMAI